jgi:hypothetical protein
MEIHALNCPEDEWTKAQFKATCLYKKVLGNKGLPDSLPLLQQCWNERKYQLSPPGSPIKADKSNHAEPGSPTRMMPTVVLVNSPTDLSTLTETMV